MSPLPIGPTTPSTYVLFVQPYNNSEFHWLYMELKILDTGMPRRIKTSVSPNDHVQDSVKTGNPDDLMIWIAI